MLETQVPFQYVGRRRRRGGGRGGGGRKQEKRIDNISAIAITDAGRTGFFSVIDSIKNPECWEYI